MTLVGEPAVAPTEQQSPTAKAANTLPRWLRNGRSQSRPRKPSPSPRHIRWWIGVIWFVISGLLLGLVAHVTLIGGLEHGRAQYLLYQKLRSDLALATAPLGQLDVNGVLVPDGTPLMILTIKRLGLSEVVVQGTTPADLTVGPGHRRDTVFPGQAGTSIIMGRQATYGGPFSALSGLVPGDTITATTGQGTSTYKVFGIRREGDLLPEPLKSGDGRLELVTADGIPLAPSGTLHIDAALESTAHDAAAPVFSQEVLDPSEFAMAGDAHGWFATLFWFQLLTVAAIALRWIRARWGTWQTWIVALPILLALGAATANAAMTMLPNLL